METGIPGPLSPEELLEWEAFHFFEPFGTPAEDDRWSILYTLTHSAHFKQTGQATKWLDRDPEETARLAAKAHEAMTLEDKVLSFFAGIAAIEEDPPA